MARAYAYAEGDGPEPWELAQLRAIDRFGAQGIMGRPLGYGEARRMRLAENVVNAYRLRAGSENWAEWASKNPEMSALLVGAMKAAGIDNG